MNYKTLPIFLAFLIMGVADAMGPMGDAVKNQYQLSNVMATMLAFFVFIAFANYWKCRIVQNSIPPCKPEYR